MPASQLALEAQLAEARALINALQTERTDAAAQKALEADGRYKRMDASLWEKPILQDIKFKHMSF